MKSLLINYKKYLSYHMSSTHTIDIGTAINTAIGITAISITYRLVI
jgi:hypothetical protein